MARNLLIKIRDYLSDNTPERYTSFSGHSAALTYAMIKAGYRVHIAEREIRPDAPLSSLTSDYDMFFCTSAADGLDISQFFVDEQSFVFTRKTPNTIYIYVIAEEASVVDKWITACSEYKKIKDSTSSVGVKNN